MSSLFIFVCRNPHLITALKIYRLLPPHSQSAWACGKPRILPKCSSSGISISWSLCSVPNPLSFWSKVCFGLRLLTLPLLLFVSLSCSFMFSSTWRSCTGTECRSRTRCWAHFPSSPIRTSCGIVAHLSFVSFKTASRALSSFSWIKAVRPGRAMSFCLCISWVGLCLCRAISSGSRLVCCCKETESRLISESTGKNRFFCGSLSASSLGPTSTKKYKCYSNLGHL